MNTVKIRDIEIGTGAPKIIVPIVGVTKEDIIEETCDHIVVKAYPGGNPNKKQEKQSEDITH